MIWCSLQSRFTKQAKSSTVKCSQFSSTRQSLLIQSAERDYGKSQKTIICLNKCITVMQQHDGMVARVYDNGLLSGSYPVPNAVFNGCILALTLFSVMFAGVLTDAFRYNDIWVNIRYRNDGTLFNLKMRKFKTKVKYVNIKGLVYADNCILNYGREEGLQNNIDRFSAAVFQLWAHHQHG